MSRQRFKERRTELRNAVARLQEAVAQVETPIVREAVENAPLIYHIDIVRPEEMANARLKEKIARDGVVIYPA